MRFYIFCDESINRGSIYSNFYGGLVVNVNAFIEAERVLKATIDELQTSEVKWSKVNQYNLAGYKKLMDALFGLVSNGYVKIRIMFVQNRHKGKKLTDYHKEHEYHLLYYQFIKHAIGLKYVTGTEPVHLEFFFDDIPDKKEKNKKFKDFVYGIQFLPEFSESRVIYTRRDISEVDSKNHILLQGLDVVLGAMSFRLNRLHEEKDPATGRRGKRTRAKENLYKHILKHIRIIKPNFNIGITTGSANIRSQWTDEYRHWNFKPKE
ncbi:MAG TPA: DUF3800 domain-containing protein [Cyclobacteriaceae bacterium]